MRAWVRALGRLPCTRDWEHAASGRPCARTVRRRWGWYELMADALDIDLAEILELEGQLLERGLLPRRPRRPREDLLGALIAYRELCGYWPSGRDWDRATPEHPRGGRTSGGSVAGGPPLTQRRRSCDDRSVWLGARLGFLNPTASAPGHEPAPI